MVDKIKLSRIQKTFERLLPMQTKCILNNSNLNKRPNKYFRMAVTITFQSTDGKRKKRVAKSVYGITSAMSRTPINIAKESVS